MNLTILILNIIGTFLLSVEAIKLENFEKFRNHLRKSNSILNPKIEWVDSDEEVTNSYGCYFFILLVILCFSPISFLITYKLAKNHLNIYYIIGISLFGSLVIWTFIIYTFEFIIKILKMIEKNVAHGIIGIIGFLILVISFICQYYAANNAQPITAVLRNSWFHFS
jgi:hypothetical protein